MRPHNASDSEGQWQEEAYGLRLQNLPGGSRKAPSLPSMFGGGGGGCRHPRLQLCGWYACDCTVLYVSAHVLSLIHI
eukprot:15457894-Alexandrium_andersonii.AAC.1